jgi:RNA polymerase sigma factor (sigma-70 family)
MANRSLHPLLHYLRRLGSGGDGSLEDAQLLGRFLTNRDESAFTMIVQRYGAMVWGLCVRRLGETPEAEDAFQATFLVLVRKAASLRGPQLLGPWLYGVANRTALKLRGQRTRQAAQESSLPEQLADEQPESMAAELRPMLDEEINRLPTKYRLPVLLCYLQGVSCEEAAERLGCAKGTVFSRLSRGRDLLRRRLIRRGLDVSAGALAAVLVENTALQAMPPAVLRETTIRMSLLLATGTAGQALSAPLAALVEGVLRSMFLNKVKFAVIIVLALGLAGAGAGFLGHRTDAEQPAVKQKPKPATAKSGDVAIKIKEKTDKSQPYVPPPFVGDEKQRLRDWREKLMQPITFGVLEGNTLNKLLAFLKTEYNVICVINQRAFEEDLGGGRDIGETDISLIPEMRVSLAAYLRIVLDRISFDEPNKEAVFLVRRDYIEITTSPFARRELGYRSEMPFNNERPLPPLIWDAFDAVALTEILPRLAETSGYNVVADPKAGEKLQTKITAQLRNVPVETAVRLLANMAGLSMVRLDNVFYVTTAENAKQMREEQRKIDADLLLGGRVETPTKPASDKPAK